MSKVIDDNEARQNIAANVRRLLRDRGWDQKDLAERTGEYPMTISRIARGLNMPGAGLLGRIAEAFDVSTDRLLSAPPTPADGEPTKPEKILPKSA